MDEARRPLLERIRRYPTESVEGPWVIGLGVSCAVLASAGVAIYGLHSFGEGVLAELAGMALSVLVAVVVIERILDNQRRHRWDAVRELTTSGIRRHCEEVIDAFVESISSALSTELVVSYYGTIAETDPAKRLPAMYDIWAQGLLTIHGEELAKLSADAGSRKVTPVLELFERARPDLDVIEHSLAPRVIDLGAEPALAARLVALSDQTHRWAAELRKTSADRPSDFLAWGMAQATYQETLATYVATFEPSAPDPSDMALRLRRFEKQVP